MNITVSWWKLWGKEGSVPIFQENLYFTEFERFVHEQKLRSWPRFAKTYLSEKEAEEASTCSQFIMNHELSFIYNSALENG